MVAMFSFVIDVVHKIEDDGVTQEQKYMASELSKSVQTFDFIFCLHLTKILLGITNELSQELQRKEQDIVNALNLVRVCKHRLQEMRDSGWDGLLDQVNSFCEKHDVDICNMDDMFLLPGRSRRKAPQMTILHYYCAKLFCVVIDLQLINQLENRFIETSIELLHSMGCLNPSNLFSTFNKRNLIHLASFYPNAFSNIDLLVLDDQLQTYIFDMRTTTVFSNLYVIGDLAQKMVETKRNKVLPLVYLLIKLALTLPVVTATVERAFSAMNNVKN